MSIQRGLKLGLMASHESIRKYYTNSIGEWMIAPHESMKLSKNFMGGSFMMG
jgi:hypothetical protein